MITKIPDDIAATIANEASETFGRDIGIDLVHFIQEFQSTTAIDEGFAKKNTVRFYNLAVFKFNPKRIDSKNTMKRLLQKYNGDINKSLKEFRILGKSINQEEKKAKVEAKLVKSIVPKPKATIKSLNGKFTVR